MFGVLGGMNCNLLPVERHAWQGHICGLCLSLRDNFGFPTQIATNYDAAIISVLCAAQTPSRPNQYTSHCLLRRVRKLDITAPDTPGTRFAASIALAMAAIKIQDNISDGDNFWHRIPRAADFIVRKWLARATKEAQIQNFNLDNLIGHTRRQLLIEKETGRDFYHYAAPTELAVGEAFQHTAVITLMPQNSGPLFDMGRMFGRIIYLLDSFRDLTADAAQGKFNPLLAAYTVEEIPTRAGQIFKHAYDSLRDSFSHLDLPRPSLARALLLGKLNHRGQAILGLKPPPAYQTSMGDWQLPEFEDDNEPPHTRYDDDDENEKRRGSFGSGDCCGNSYGGYQGETPCYLCNCNNGCDLFDCKDGCDLPDCGDGCDMPDIGNGCDALNCADGCDSLDCSGLDCADFDCGGADFAGADCGGADCGGADCSGVDCS